MDNKTLQRIMVLAGLISDDDIPELASQPETTDVTYDISSNDEDDIIIPVIDLDDIKASIINAVEATIPEEILSKLDITFDVELINDCCENSEFDYRTNPAKPNGEDGEIDAYRTLGQAKLPTRYVPAKSGDNPLTGKSFEDYYDEISKD